jgi:hypothetical protein
MTQKKKRPMKQNGGGPAFSMFSSAAKEEDENNFDVLLITTHGDYPDPELTTFKPKPIPTLIANFTFCNNLCTVST